MLHRQQACPEAGRRRAPQAAIPPRTPVHAQPFVPSALAKHARMSGGGRGDGCGRAPNLCGMFRPVGRVCGRVPCAHANGGNRSGEPCKGVWGRVLPYKACFTIIQLTCIVSSVSGVLFALVVSRHGSDGAPGACMNTSTASTRIGTFERVPGNRRTHCGAPHCATYARPRSAHRAPRRRR